MEVKNSCTCEKCKNMCKTPCMGTLTDILKLVKAGYTDRLSKSMWGVGMITETYPSFIPFIGPKIDEKTGYCTFYKNGLCELHDLGLKPTEGALTHCTDKVVITKEEFKETINYKIAMSWVKVNKELDLEKLY